MNEFLKLIDDNHHIVEGRKQKDKAARIANQKKEEKQRIYRQSLKNVGDDTSADTTETSPVTGPEDTAVTEPTNSQREIKIQSINNFFKQLNMS